MPKKIFEILVLTALTVGLIWKILELTPKSASHLKYIWIKYVKLIYGFPVQSDHVIAMQNGCFCCTLQSDLVDQIVELAQKKIFNYMVIEASGVSEPSQIAPLFDLCDDDHDHETEHKAHCYFRIF